jgi:hypothetical protein
MTKSPILYAVDAGCLCSTSGLGQGKEKEVNLRTEETKVARMDDGFCIRFTRQVVEGREATADIGDAEYSAMDGVYQLCLGVDLVGARAGTEAG